MSIYNWDLQASNNDTADDQINWREGQSPSSINNSARMMMQRIREYITDTGGSLNGNVVIDRDKGTTAITIAAGGRYTQLKDGMLLRFRASATNVGVTTIQVDASPAVTAKKVVYGGLSDLIGGEIQQGGIYEIVYHYETWHLMNATHIPPELPDDLRPFATGTISAFAMQNLPDGWLECDGRAVSRVTYKRLLDTIGLTWGIGDGVNTFNIPDLRGMFLRGLDKGRGIDRNRQFGDQQEAAFKVHRPEGETGPAQFAPRVKRDLGVEPDDGIEINEDGVVWVMNRSRRSVIDKMPQAERMKLIGEIRKLVEHHHIIVGHFAGGAETRPVNMAIIYAIKT